MSKYNFILASASPRRQQLLKALGFKFNVRIKKIRETYPDILKREQIPLYLSELKANAFEKELKKNQIIIAADTIVWIDNKPLEKPIDFKEAAKMLNILSGRVHEVITGVCLKSIQKTKLFFVTTKVYFKKLSKEQIVYYINNFKPFDKAGAYGIQEWIGSTGVKKIKGSYFNVMGLPIKELYEELRKF